MNRYCNNCGTQIEDNTKFCPNCGAAIAAPAPVQQNTTQYNNQPAQTYAAQPYQQAPAQQYGVPVYGVPVYAGNGVVRQGIPAPGFSDRVNHPEIVATIKKNRKAAGIFAFFLVPLPVIGAVIYAIVSEKTDIGQAAMMGGIVSAVFLAFALFSFIRERAKNTYEATVIDKKSRLTYRHKNSDDQEMVTEYVTVVRTVDGKKKKIVEHEGTQIWAWDYLQPGDRFKYHPQFHFPYELYDKSRAPYIACVSCGTKNPVEADRCKKCGLPLLK